MHAYIHTYIHTHIHIHTYIHIGRKEMFYLTMHSTHFYVWIYSVSTYIHIHMHTYIHNYIHTYIVTHTQLLMRDPLNYFSFQPVFHNWCSKGLWNDAYKRTLAANWKEYPILQQRVSSRFLSSPLPYVLCHTRK